MLNCRDVKNDHLWDTYTKLRLAICAAIHCMVAGGSRNEFEALANLLEEAQHELEAGIGEIQTPSPKKAKKAAA